MNVKFLLLPATIFAVTACEPMNNRNDTTAQMLPLVRPPALLSARPCLMTTTVWKVP